MGSSETKQVDTEAAFAAMSQGAQVVTANRRLALDLKTRYDRLQVNQGKLVWGSPNILSWSDWIREQFQELQDLGATDKTLLTPHQTHILWQQIIESSERGQAILNISNTARMAQDAWEITQSWLINRKQLANYANDETNLFLSWVDTFERRCSDKNWIDSSKLPAIVSEHIANAALSVPDMVILAGFDELTPQQHKVLSILNGVSSLVSAEVTNSVKRLQVLDTKHEINTAVRWAINRLQLDAGASIGLVVPKLAELRRDIELILDRCLNPSSILPNISSSDKAYNISLGIPLAQCSLVLDALTVLRFARGTISSKDLGRLLRSPFLAGAKEEGEHRALLDAYIRSNVGEYEVSIDTLIRKLVDVNNREDGSCPILLENLQEFRQLLDQLRKHHSPHEWTELFQAILRVFGWGRSEEMDSVEFQQLDKFNSLFNSFQQLGHINNSIQLHEALGHLHTIAADTPFHAQGGSDAPIQVVGILEAAGLNFDHLWVLGLNDNVWPQPAAPNPLLPISLQHKLDLPHASPHRELEYASAITQRLLSGAREVVVSHAQTDGKKQLRASPLISHIPELSVDDLDIAQIGETGRIGFNSAMLEQIVDNTAPELPTDSYLPGGSSLLTDQSACPFRAFANHRLGADGLEEPVSGIDARTKGIITHRVLQLLWQQIGDQERLLAIDAIELKQLVENIVSHELAILKKHRPETFTPRFIAIEQDRLTELIIEWLELEKQRAPFKTVSLEQKERINLSGLELDVRVDRVDLLEDGSKLIIDYKTGKNLSYRGWFEQRIEEPQLPLYSTTESEKISGVCLAGVNQSKPGFKGITEQGGVVPGVKEFAKNRESADYSSWDGLKHAWKQRLKLLAEEILAGRADVCPKEAKVCTYCPLPSFCRIHEWGDD